MAPTYVHASQPITAALSRLEALGCTEAAVAARLGLEDLNDLQLRALPIYRQERLEERDPLALAIELFLLQGALGPAEVASLFPGGEQEALVEAGLLAWNGGALRALASLYPVGRRLIFSDRAWPQMDQKAYSTVPYDQVMYVGTDSRWLARATVRRPVASALDLCCGSGIHALLAADHAQRVTAVDLNPRAVACTAFNARAMGLEHLEALQGDLYAPVAGRSFDLITCNPPFVPAPAQEVGFRDGGHSGEAIQRRLIEGLPRHLAPGGLCQIVTEFGERDGEPLEDRIRLWLGGAPMDLHILRLRSSSAQVYAIGHADGDDHAAFLASVGEWAANLRAQQYTSISSVLLAFQWSEAPWTRVDEADPPRREAGNELEGLFRAEALARDPALPQRLASGRVARAGPVALLGARTLGTTLAATTQARLAGMALPVHHNLAPLEEDLLCCLDRPVATAELLAVGERAGLTGEAVLDALVALVRKGFVLPQD